MDNIINPNIPGLDTSFVAGQRVSVRTSRFPFDLSAGAIVAALTDPFGSGSTYETMGIVPSQLALAGDKIVRGAGAAVAGSRYTIWIVAISPDGIRQPAVMLTFRAQLPLGGVPGVAPTPTPAPIPSEMFIAVVSLDGQSDQAGRGVFNSAIDTNDAKVKQFCSHPGSANYRTIRDSIYPLYHPEGPDSNQIGPGQTLGKRLAEQLGPNCAYVLLVPNAFGNTGLVASGGRWSVGGDLHEASVAQTQAALAAAQAIYPASFVHSAHWIQGNNDGGTPQLDYENALAARYADMIARVPTMTTSTPIVIGSMLPIAIETQPNKQTTELAQMNVAAARPAWRYVPGPYGSVLSSEAPGYIHMGTNGCRAVGTNLANAALGTKTVDFARSGWSVTEGTGGTSTMTLLGYRSDAAGTATANVTITPGTAAASDFPGGVLPTVSFTWGPGQNRATATITVNGDADVESDESFTLSLTAPSGYVVGTRPTAAGAIVNDDSGAPPVTTDLPAQTGLYAYYDVSDRASLFQDTARTTPVTAAGQAVMSITDKSGNERHATGVGSPILGLIGTKDAVVVDGATQRFDISIIAAMMGTSAEFTIHDILMADEEANASRARWSSGHTSNSSRRTMMNDAIGGTLRYVARSTDGTLSQPTFGTTKRGIISVISVRRKADGNMVALQDGIEVHNAILPVLAQSVNAFHWLARRNAATVDSYFKGRGGSLVAYSIAQADTDFAAVHEFLRTKWA